MHEAGMDHQHQPQGLVLVLRHLRPQAQLVATGVRVERLAELAVGDVHPEAGDGEGDGLLVVADNAEVTLEGRQLLSELLYGVRGRCLGRGGSTCGHAC